MRRKDARPPTNPPFRPTPVAVPMQAQRLDVVRADAMATATLPVDGPRTTSLYTGMAVLKQGAGLRNAFGPVWLSESVFDSGPNQAPTSLGDVDKDDVFGTNDFTSDAYDMLGGTGASPGSPTVTLLVSLGGTWMANHESGAFSWSTTCARAVGIPLHAALAVAGGCAGGEARMLDVGATSDAMGGSVDGAPGGPNDGEIMDGEPADGDEPLDADGHVDGARGLGRPSNRGHMQRLIDPAESCMQAGIVVRRWPPSTTRTSSGRRDSSSPGHRHPTSRSRSPTPRAAPR